MNTYIIALSASGVAETYTLPLQTFQGTTEIAFNLSNVVENVYKVIKVVVDFGDSTNILTQQPQIITTYANSSETLKIAENGQTNRALDTIYHAYYATTSAYYTIYNCVISVTYSNLAQSVITAPIRVAQTSFFSEYDEISLLSTQLVSVSTNDVYAVLQSKNGSMYNLVIK